MADGEPTERPVPVQSVARGRPFVIRYPQVALAGLRLARTADVIYATATYAAAAAAAIGARRPLVAKLVSDPAYERAWRYGLFRGSLEAFQQAGDPRSAALRQLRTTSLRAGAPDRRAEPVPRRDRRRLGARPGRIEVLVNPAPPPADVEPAPLEPGTFVFVGRLTHQKALPVLLEAIAAVDGARLELVGDGADRAALEATRRGARARRSSPLRRRAAARPGARASRGRARRRPLERLGEPAARRRRGAVRRARPSSRPPSAACRRSCATARTACSSRRTIPRRWPARCARSCTTTRSGRGSPRPRSRRSPRSAAT